MARMSCKCGHMLIVADAYIGRSARCGKCQAVCIVTADNAAGDTSEDEEYDDATSADDSSQATSQTAMPSASSRSPTAIPVESEEDSNNRPVPWQFNVGLGLIAVIAILALLPLLKSAPVVSSNQEWEYTVESPDDLFLETRLNNMGKEGWEVVSARRASAGRGDSATYSYEMILKRPAKKN